MLQFDCPTAFWPVTREPEFCQLWDWWRNINYNVSFHFNYFQKKLMTKFFKKSRKHYLGVILGPFFQFGQKWVFLGKWTLSVFKHSNYLPSCEKSEKDKKPFLRIMPNWQTDGRTDRRTDRQRWFYRTIHWTGVQKTNKS